MGRYCKSCRKEHPASDFTFTGGCKIANANKRLSRKHVRQQRETQGSASTKLCKHCGQLRPSSSFSSTENAGVSKTCDACRTVSRQKYNMAKGAAAEDEVHCFPEGTTATSFDCEFITTTGDLHNGATQIPHDFSPLAIGSGNSTLADAMHVFGQAETGRLEKRGGLAMADMAENKRTRYNVFHGRSWAGGRSLPVDENKISNSQRLTHDIKDGFKNLERTETHASPSSRGITINDQTHEGDEKEEEGEVVCLTELRGLILQNAGLLNLITQIKLPAAGEPNPRLFVQPRGDDIALVVPLRAWCHPDAGDITRQFIKLRRHMEVYLSQNRDWILYKQILAPVTCITERMSLKYLRPQTVGITLCQHCKDRPIIWPLECSLAELVVGQHCADCDLAPVYRGSALGMNCTGVEEDEDSSDSVARNATRPKAQVLWYRLVKNAKSRSCWLSQQILTREQISACSANLIRWIDSMEYEIDYPMEYEMARKEPRTHMDTEKWSQWKQMDGSVSEEVQDSIKVGLVKTQMDLENAVVVLLVLAALAANLYLYMGPGGLAV